MSTSKRKKREENQCSRNQELRHGGQNVCPSNTSHHDGSSIMIPNILNFTFTTQRTTFSIDRLITNHHNLHPMASKFARYRRTNIMTKKRKLLSSSIRESIVHDQGRQLRPKLNPELQTSPLSKLSISGGCNCDHNKRNNSERIPFQDISNILGSHNYLSPKLVYPISNSYGNIDSSLSSISRKGKSKIGEDNAGKVNISVSTPSYISSVVTNLVKIHPMKSHEKENVNGTQNSNYFNTNFSSQGSIVIPISSRANKKEVRMTAKKNLKDLSNMSPVLLPKNTSKRKKSTKPSDLSGSSNCTKRTKRRHAPKKTGLYDKAEKEVIVDIGDPSYSCPYCQAYMWYDENTGKIKKTRSPKFSLCCMNGKIVLPYLKKPPSVLYNLFTGNDRRSKHFTENMRAYNNMFAFTSIGGKVVSSINNGSGPPQFVLSGQNYHCIGTLLPKSGQHPKFAQLYIYDTQNENMNRMRAFSSAGKGDQLDITIVEDLKNMIDKHNALAQSFRRVRDLLVDNSGLSLSLRLIRTRGKDARTYNLPTCDEVAALIVGDLNSQDFGRDIIVGTIDGGFQRLHETHTAFIPLQYPLMFPYGDDGFKEDIPYSDDYMKGEDLSRLRVTLREWIAYRIQDREVEHGNLILGRRLFQQFVVDAYTMIEAQRLSFIKHNQKMIRAEFLSGVEEAISQGETDPSSVGMRIILPSSFTGGRRYMFNNCQDAMAFCKKFGYPDLFVTCTCNSSWPEISRHLRSRNLRPDERPDICCRIFKIKLNNLMSDFRKGKIFGRVEAGMYTIEFQKRGLPHAHILLWLSKVNKIVTCDDIDKHISAELPDPLLYPKLSKAVASYMIHGPCGAAGPSSPCMVDAKCSNFFPKKYQLSTSIDEDGYPIYKRRDSGFTVMKKGVAMDNSFVVPYNPRLLMRYQGHINVEYCNKSNSIKYLFKYVSKGPDRVSAHVTNSEGHNVEPQCKDEIKQYYDCRYLTPCEAVWRIFSFHIHHRWPPVLRLNFHLPNQQRVLFKDDDDLEDIVNKPSIQTTMFLAWLDANKKYDEAKSLSYSEFPTKFVFNEKNHKWRRRKKGFSIGRIQYVPPGIGELFYMRILLTVQKGCTSFESIRTVDGVLYPSFHDACYAMGLLADDREYVDAIVEANELGSGSQLRKLFVALLTTSTMAKPELVWEKTWKLLAQDVLYFRRISLQIPDLQINDHDLKNLCLIEIEKLMQQNGRSLKEYDCLPYLDFFENVQFENKFVADELNYNTADMNELFVELYHSMTDEQKSVFDSIFNSVLTNKPGFFFLYGFGGSGKTFIWNTLSAAIRSKGLIVLNVASSGIASLLLPGGRTAHSKFSIPIAINECSTCNIKQGFQKAELLRKANLIIWDEAPMLNKHCFEAVNKTLCDIMNTPTNTDSYVLFGGKIVVLGGDFRQILPVIPKGSRGDIVGSAINASHLWKYCKVLRLTNNMRLSNCQNSAESNEIREFGEWILEVGDGKLNINGEAISELQIPSDLLIEDCHTPMQSLISFTYPQIVINLTNKNYNYFEERAILAPTLDSVESVNTFLLGVIPGDEREYLSFDSTCRSDQDKEVDSEWFTTEFLNEIKCSGIPNHKLILKVGVPIMLLRNIDQSGGLCNGTRLIVTDLGKNVIAANVVTGKRSGEKIFIARMNLIPSDSGLPFRFQRRQFPVSLCFAMTINKSQGQSLSHVGLYLPKPVFTHGQLYVALSRVKSRKGLKILILNEEGTVASCTKNVVYTEVFDNV